MNTLATNSNYMDDGCIRITIKSRNAIIYKIPRDVVKNYSDKRDLKHSGIYLLVNDENHSIYVGQAESRKTGKGILARMLERHSSEEIGKWNWGYAITSGDPNFLFSTELDYLECYFYKEAKKDNLYTLLNAFQPHTSGGSFLGMDLRPFYTCVLFSLTNLLACAAFSRRDLLGRCIPNSERPGSYLSTPSTPSIAVGTSINKTFCLKANNDVKVIFLPDRKIDVRVGTAVSTENHLPYQKGQEGNAKLRAKLNEDGIIVNNVFVKGYVFDNPSQAASIILGRSANGNTEWIDENGILFDKYPEAFHKKSKSIS